MIPELETHRPCYLFDYPYPELLTCKEPVVDEQGMLWAGKDRKTEMQSDAYRKSLWRAWQQSFKTRKYFPAQDAMDYFQATKHLSRPPQGGDTTLGTGQPLKPVNVPPVFTWSPSKIMTFDTCPYQFAATYYYKTVPYTETVATKWGTRVHEEAERYMKGQASADPGAFKVVEKWVKVLDKVQGERFIEYRMGVDENLKEAKWTEAEGRMILDLGILNGEELRLYDWKGLSLETPLPTPSGWTTMGDVKVGDSIFGADGQPCRVVGKSQIKHLPCYKITFCDGAEIVCDEEHLWEINSYGRYPRKMLSQVITTPEIQSVERPFIRLASPINCDFDSAHTLPMYTIGCWLGDGKHTDGSITKLDQTMFVEIEKEGLAVLPAQKTADGKTPCRTIKGLRTILVREGLLGNKHVKQAYLRRSYADRIALLQGLMDSDGYWNNTRQQCVFVTVKQDVAEAVMELLYSLGQRPKLHSVKKHGFGKEFYAWDIAFSPINMVPFRCAHRLEKFYRTLKPTRRPRAYRYIRKIEQVSSVPTQCISVDSYDSMYLCGKEMIPTHNTGKKKADDTQMKIYALIMALRLPQVQKISYRYIWLKDGTTTGDEVTRKELLPIAKELKAKLNRMKDAWNTESWRQVRNGLCRSYCGAKECEHCGR